MVGLISLDEWDTHQSTQTHIAFSRVFPFSGGAKESQHKATIWAQARILGAKPPDVSTKKPVKGMAICGQPSFLFGKQALRFLRDGVVRGDS